MTAYSSIMNAYSSVMTAYSSIMTAYSSVMTVYFFRLKNWVFTTNSNLQIPIFLRPDIFEISKIQIIRVQR